MHIITIDPRVLDANPDDARQSNSSPQADALLLATVKAVGIIQPPVVSPQLDGGNGYTIQAGHRRVKAAIAAGLEEIQVLVTEASDDNGAMRSMVENIAREPLNPVDQWRGIERLVALGWTEEAIAVALAFPVRQIRKLRLLANVLPAMLDQMARGDMPNEQQLRTIAADDLWMSPCYKQPCVALHFTWKKDWPAVEKLLPQIEEQLAPFDARPHWGKLFTTPPARLQSLYTKLPEFRALLRAYDPHGKFRNAFLDTYIFGAA